MRPEKEFFAVENWNLPWNYQDSLYEIKIENALKIDLKVTTGLVSTKFQVEIHIFLFDTMNEFFMKMTL